ncbi:MAG TPA: PQQ-dependent sugar dehydrogenase [Candidatus Saccharimonadales bacterium]|jgi:glucose/arabinose dehydrogenase
MAEMVKGAGAYEIDKGYRLEKVADGISYPSNIAFSPAGQLFYTEAGFTYPFIYKKSRIIWLTDSGENKVVAEGFNGPLVGLTWHDDGFLVTHRGTFSRVELDGTRTDLISDLPSYGDHHTDHIVIRDGKVYFGQGTITNSSVVGKDSLAFFGWLAKHQDGHDTPGHDIVLSGANYETINPLKPTEKVTTGPFLPIGTPAKKGQVIKGQLKSNGVVYRCNPDGSDLEVYAWGFRHPYGMTLDKATGKIYVLDQGADKRGSRPVESPEALYELKQDAWYGWPDYLAGKPITELQADSEFAMAEHPPHEKPLKTFEEHSSCCTVELSTSDHFGYKGQAFISEYGSEAPFTTGGKPLGAGRRVTRLDLGTMTEHPFFESKTIGVIGDGPNRPVAAKFSPDGETLYILDHGIRTVPKSGSLWKITRT